MAYYYPTYGGATQLATRMAGYLIEHGHNVHFIGYDTDINPRDLREKGIQLHKVKRIELPATTVQPYIWTLANKVCTVNQRVHLDLLHVHYAIPYALSAYLAKQALALEGKRLPYIVTGHGTDIHTYGGLRDINTMLRLALNQADALTYVSKKLHERAEKSVEEGGLGITKKGSHITNFIDTNNFYPDPSSLREDLNIPLQGLIIGHSSNFAPVKQTYHFLDLAKYLRRVGQLDDIYFLMCGKGQRRDELQERVKKSGLENHFRFRGKLDQNELRLAYSAMDVSMLSSQREGCPLAALESMACGTPVIGTRVEGIEQLIKTGETGFLFDPEDIQGLAKIIVGLKRSRRKLERMSENTRKYIEQNHSVDVVMGQYLAIYNEILGGKIFP